MTAQARFSSIPYQRTATAQRVPVQAFYMFVLAVALVLGSGLRAQARGVPESFADLVEKVSPAVVDITTTTMIAQDMTQQPMVPEGSPFEEFFKDFMDKNGNGQPHAQRSQALGSGFVISEDGYIVTNNHVIDGADQIQIEFNNGDVLDASVVGADPNTDIALLKVEAAEPLSFVTFGDSDIMRVGDWVMAVGNPLGQGFSVSAGIISARGRQLSGTYDDFIQTDAAINKGNSGGPLFNMEGQVIGVNTAILSPSGGSIGIGFSMASNVVSKVVDQLQQFGETRRGWLGVRIQDVTADVADAMGLDNSNGALVTDVPDGPAKDAGIVTGDVILNFDGQDVTDTRSLVRIVGDAPVGKSVRVVLLRDGETQTVKVTLGRREEAELAAAPMTQEEPATPPEPASKAVLGMTLSEMTDQISTDLGLSADATGLVVMDVDQSSDAFDKGLRAGDVIEEAGQQRVASIDDIDARISEAQEAGRSSILLLIRRQGNPRFVAVNIDK